MKFFPSFIVLIYSLGAQTHWETAIRSSDEWKYLVPLTQPSDDWPTITYNDSSWNSGNGGFGYGDGDDLTTIPSPLLSVFLRKKFIINNPSDLKAAILHTDYDDGYIAYINGIEISRSSNMGSPGEFIAYNEGTNSIDHEAQLYQGIIPESCLLDSMSLSELIHSGENILSIQINNIQESSSDFSSNFFLSFKIDNDTSIFNETPDWFIDPVVFNQSNLPIIKIDTYGETIIDDPRIPAYMGIINNENNLNHINDPFNDYSGEITIELRGNSSQYNPKKPYRFETVDENGENNNVSLLGMPSENDWVLYAPYQDKSLMRNVLAYKLSNEMGRYTSRTKFCELYINEEYLGVYVLMEKIKRDGDRVDISKLEPDEISGDDLTGGYILKFDWAETGDNNGGFYSEIDGNLYNYHYPKPSDIVSEQKNYIIQYINDFETIMDSQFFSDPVNGYSDFMNVESFIDHILLQEFSKNVDAYRLSTYIYKDKESIDNRLTAGPLWDINHGFGNCDYGEAWLSNGFLLDYNPEGGDQMSFWWEKLWSDQNFKDQFSVRYTELGNNTLSVNNIYSIIDSLKFELRTAADRNFYRWPILGSYVWPNYLVFDTFDQEIDYLKSWIVERLNWMDSQVLLKADSKIIFNDYLLMNVYPNPFNPELNINLKINTPDFYDLEIYDINGKLIETLGKDVYLEKESNYYQWNGKNYHSGIYFISLSGNNRDQVIKVTLVK